MTTIEELENQFAGSRLTMHRITEMGDDDLCWKLTAKEFKFVGGMGMWQRVDLLNSNKLSYFFTPLTSAAFMLKKRNTFWCGRIPFVEHVKEAHADKMETVEVRLLAKDNADRAHVKRCMMMEPSPPRSSILEHFQAVKPTAAQEDFPTRVKRFREVLQAKAAAACDSDDEPLSQRAKAKGGTTAERAAWVRGS